MDVVAKYLSQENAEAISAAIELPDEYIGAIAKFGYTVFGPTADAFEKLIATSFPEVYAYVDGLTKHHIHPMSKKLPLMNAWYALYGVGFYFVALFTLFVFAKLVGKGKYRLLGIAHNFFLFLLSLYMSFNLMVSTRAAGYSLWNNGVGDGPVDWRIAKVLWLFYVSKLPEFMDTFLMVLKHNYHQVSFLHMYHHTTVFLIWFVCTLSTPGGEPYWSAMVNSGIHVLMYGYYMLTMIFETGRVRQFLNNFKFFITKGQMTQFLLNCVQSVYDLYVVPRSELICPADLLHLLLWYMVTLLVLFGNFLIRNQGQPRHSVKPVPKVATNGKAKTAANGAASAVKPQNNTASTNPTTLPAPRTSGSINNTNSGSGKASKSAAAENTTKKKK